MVNKSRPNGGSRDKKTRPSIIVNDDALGKLPLKVIVPLTDWKEHYSIAPWMVKIIPDKINKLTKESAADCFQIRSVAEERLVKYVGYITPAMVEKIKISLKTVLGME